MRLDRLHRHSFVGLLCFVGLSGCNYPPPPAAWSGETAPSAAPPPPPPVALEAPPPPPPPKCEDLSEGCTATASTSLSVGSAGASFTVPEGWHYARRANDSVAVSPDGGAWLVLAPLPSADAKDVAPAIDAVVAQQGVTGYKPDSLKKRLKKPQQTLPAGAGTVDLWEVSKDKQGAAPSLPEKGSGTMLVLLGKPDAAETLLGVAFVIDAAAEADAPKIMQAVQSLKGKP